MNCLDCQVLFEAYLRGELSAEKRQAVAEHLSGCPACQAGIEAEIRLDAMLAGRPLKPLPAGFTHRVVARVRRPRTVSPLIPALAYVVSITVLLASLYRVFGWHLHSFVFGGTAGEVSGWDAGIVHEMSALQARVAEAAGGWSLLQGVHLQPYVVEAGAALIWLGLSWILYEVFRREKMFG